ncbi:hypothetical protein ADUPG1_003506 [Aduncisulcus paluster]|uniref:Chromo domain-containing protein n=1 Tax=Aduncisulcus paluster TaxID=2918883 RepID=A0ABQ5KYT3_9EUKA|nr:hypothetical protein ADUPG1_003506 [Aduncisulcus paluster]
MWCMLALNTRIHSSTKQVPFEAMFGRAWEHDRVSEKKDDEDSIKNLSDTEERDTYVERVKATVKERAEEIRSEEGENPEPPKGFEVGEFVRKIAQRKKKHDPWLAGPYVITERISPFRYKLKSSAGGKMIMASLRQLQKFNKGDQTEEELIRACARDSEDFPVEKIIIHRFGTKKPIIFKIRWKGYGPEADTWGSWEDVKDCSALEQYLKEKHSLKKKFEDGKVRKQTNKTVGMGEEE